jgi:hypothetical protein
MVRELLYLASYGVQLICSIAVVELLAKAHRRSRRKAREEARRVELERELDARRAAAGLRGYRT